MLFALAQINPIVGDLEGNARLVVERSREAASLGADLVVFPELCVTGYPPLDLLENHAFVDDVERTISRIAADVPSRLGVIIGAPVRNPARVGKRLQNVAIVLEDGRETARVVKALLPTYDIFDEYRYFEPGTHRDVVSFRGLRLGLHVCEDMWNNEEQAPYHLYEANPIDELAALGIDVFVNLSASPFAVGKHVLRNRVLSEICTEHGIPFLLVNQVGANTEVLFDGDSRAHAADGTLVACAPSFEEALVLVDVHPAADGGPTTVAAVPAADPSAQARTAVPRDDLADLHDALVMGIRDYVNKTGAFRKTLVGLSGGIDSAVTAALAVAALGPDRVVGVTMPSRFSSSGSVDDSLALARSLGIGFHEIPIGPAVDAFEGMLQPLFAGTPFGVAEENLQARARGVTLMAVSNKFDYLLLTTGNKSELSVGYATLYGDMSGGLAVIADVFKTDVYRLAEHINARHGRSVIPRSTIEKPPSAELRPDQKDTDSLPPYDVLDDILRRYVERQEDLEAIVSETGHDEAFVARILRLVDLSEYKRRQAAPGLRVSSKAFGIGRRLPIVMRRTRNGRPS